MKNYYENTFECLNKFNEIQDKMQNSSENTTEEEDEFIVNFCIYLAHALIKDTGTGGRAREELCRAADVINDVLFCM